MSALPELYRAAPCASRHLVIGPFLRGKDLVVGTIARVETGDEEQDRLIAERIAAALNHVDGIRTDLLKTSRSERPS